MEGKLFTDILPWSNPVSLLDKFVLCMDQNSMSGDMSLSTLLIRILQVQGQQSKMAIHRTEGSTVTSLPQPFTVNLVLANHCRKHYSLLLRKHVRPPFIARHAVLHIQSVAHICTIHNTYLYNPQY